MYVVEIIHRESKKKVGPTFYVGLWQEYRTMIDAMAAAQRWITKKGFKFVDYRIVPRSIGEV